ncbi:MAG: hypothetical protein F6J97_05390 [Leptolyngbya sp. SIO4C1]|nr:hypothetical protein [Leptolyngbya sp. SIO4C1]
MRLPAVLRYLPARLRPLRNPVVWMPALALAFVGIFAWEYRNHPEWLQWGGPAGVPSTETGLTPEEEAIIAEIDTLDVLLNEASINRPGAPIENPTEAAETTGLPEAETAAAPAEQSTPFADYLAQYQFGRTGAVQGANSLQAGSNRSTQLPQANGSTVQNDLFLLPEQSTAAAPPAESVLSQAISRRAAATAADDEAPAAAENPTLPSAASDIETNASETAAPAPISQQGVVPGSLPGNGNISFIRTTPEMSPPPGTTGYQPPASINFSIYDRTLNRTGQFTPGQPSTSAAPPSFETRQPQRSSGILPTGGTAGIRQPQPVRPPAAGGSVEQDTRPDNAFDAFFEGF